MRAVISLAIVAAIAGLSAPADAQDLFRTLIAPLRPVQPYTPPQAQPPAQRAPVALPDQKQVKIIETPTALMRPSAACARSYASIGLAASAQPIARFRRLSVVRV